MGIPNSQQSAARIAVVTVSYGSAPVLGGFLGSIEKASRHPLAVVIADNLSVDSEVETLARKISAVYLPLDHNYGYGGAMNRGVNTLPAEIEWVLISNPDVVLHAGCVDALVAAGDEDPAIGAVGPAIMTDDVIYPSARSVPSLRTGVGHALFANLWLQNPWTRAYRRDTAGDPIRRDAGWLSGACLLVRRSAFDMLGGFDDGYFMYFEDVDLGYRMTRSGYRNVYEPHAVVTHSGAHSTGASSARMIAVHHDSAKRFLNRKYSGGMMWPVRTALGIGLSLRSAVLSRRATRH